MIDEQKVSTPMLAVSGVLESVPEVESMKPKRRRQLRTLTCPECNERGLLRTILWGMPEAEFDYLKFASGGCLVPSLNPPDCRCSGCGFDGYRDQISGFFGDDYLFDAFAGTVDSQSLL